MDGVIINIDLRGEGLIMCIDLRGRNEGRDARPGDYIIRGLG